MSRKGDRRLTFRGLGRAVEPATPWARAVTSRDSDDAQGRKLPLVKMSGSVDALKV
jgi:hypothetical protein